MAVHKYTALIFLLICASLICVQCQDDADDDDEDDCKQEDNCKAPACRCMSRNNPVGIGSNSVPQFVMLTFDDAVSAVNFDLYKELLLGGTQTNPGGCRIGATFFVSHEYNNYAMTHELWRHGSEIATHSISHVSSTETWKTATQEKWREEYAGLKEIMNYIGKIPESEIVGFRAPFLQTSGNPTFEMLVQEKFLYDSSLPMQDTGNPVWPYTFDFGMANGHDCMIHPCPENPKKGLWIVPMISYFKENRIEGELKEVPCSMADACLPSPETEDETYDYFLKNFNRHYEKNRAPFPVFLHEAWLKHPERRKGYLKFVREIRKKNGVYIVPIKEVINYMKNPKGLIAYEQTHCVKTPVAPKCGGTGGTAGKFCNYNVTPLSGPRVIQVCRDSCPKKYPWIGTTRGQ